MDTKENKFKIKNMVISALVVKLLDYMTLYGDINVTVNGIDIKELNLDYYEDSNDIDISELE